VRRGGWPGPLALERFPPGSRGLERMSRRAGCVLVVGWGGGSGRRLASVIAACLGGLGSLPLPVGGGGRRGPPGGDPADGGSVLLCRVRGSDFAGAVHGEVGWGRAVSL